MNCHPDIKTTERRLLSFVLAAGLVATFPVIAAPVILATQPMATSTASNVKPNIMFILDDSGSMDWDYLPDWANSGTDALFKNAAYNGVYYNPAVTYTPPVLFNTAGALDTTTYPSQTGLTTATGADTSAKPNWRRVDNDAYGIQSTGNSNLVGNASFYTIVPGEYCTATDLKTCTAATAPSVTYPYAAPLRWCSSSTNAGAATPVAGSCQAIRIGSFTNARYPKGRKAIISVSGFSPTTTSVTSIRIGSGGPEILSAPTATSTTLSTVAANIANAINACAAAITGNCTVAGFSATLSGNDVTITANAPGAFSTPSISKSGSMTVSASSFSSTGANSVPGSTRYIDIIPSTSSYPYPGTTGKATTRTDCVGTTCTYAEEMTNFANWWTYYHTRMQAMKTSVSRAFKALDNRYRVGFSTIGYTGATDGTRFLGNNTFEGAHKNSWFTKLFATATPGYTPLRGALSKAGRYYGNRISGQTDPVQYSCQQNFTILSTDGYWNTYSESGSYGPLNLTGGNVGNRDGGTTPRPMKEGTTTASDTLADVAKYYYDTDLRTTALGNCSGAASPDYLSGNPDVCTNNVFTSSTDSQVQQHMTTFTMGLGIDGTLNFQTDYETAESGDFYNLKNGFLATNWPNPITNTSEARIDDLWHAAVNGRGSYFSAKDPNQIITGFTNALSSITAKLGSAAAAATSTLNPVAGNNLAFVASYTTVKWKGNIEGRTINVDTGQVSETASWCAENVLAETCPTTPVPDDSGSSDVYYCVIPATADTCTSPGVFDADAGTCSTEIANACVGTLPARVGATSDTRTIYTANDARDALIPFDAAFASAHPAYFNAALLSGLNQWGTLDATQQAAAVGVNLLNYLRGQTGYEIRGANPASNRLYRSREATLGDALESQPAFIARPTFNYSYPGYAAFKSSQASRPGTVYMGANDGMLHAFDSSNGEERWAYVPSVVIPNMWKLASTSYGTNHVNLVNGSPVISDIYCTANCGGVSGGAASWRTILVGGLNGGGRGYYALDITDPVAPILLWEFTASNGDPDLGYSFGRPVITQLDNGAWVVLVTSGYDNGALRSDGVTSNSPAGDGQGHLYVLNASTGAIISKLDTPAGDANTPSGLAQIAVRNSDPGGNKAGYVYGGDLQGNIWRFDVNEGTSPLLFARLFGPTGSQQPVTTTPILATVRTESGETKRIVIVGTGKYLEVSDLTNVQPQSLYAIKETGVTVNNPRSYTSSPNRMVQQAINEAGNVRTETEVGGGKKPVDLDTDLGWYVDFPDQSTGSERMNIDGRLVVGTLIIPTIVPSSTVCSPGGYGWLNFFDYATGWAVTDGTGVGPGGTNINVSVRYDATIVGLNVIYIKGEPVVEVITSVDPTPKAPSIELPFNIKGSTFRNVRSIWREVPAK